MAIFGSTKNVRYSDYNLTASPNIAYSNQITINGIHTQSYFNDWLRHGRNIFFTQLVHCSHILIQKVMCTSAWQLLQ